MATADLERMLDEWAIAWSSSANTDPERVLALFADDGRYEDVTSGVVVRGKEDLRRYLIGAFATIPDFTVGVLRWFGAGPWTAFEWTMSGTHRGDWAGREHPRAGGREDPPPVRLLGCGGGHETGRPAAVATGIFSGRCLPLCFGSEGPSGRTLPGREYRWRWFLLHPPRGRNALRRSENADFGGLGNALISKIEERLATRSCTAHKF
jgi:SnoaL-like domain